MVTLVTLQLDGVPEQICSADDDHDDECDELQPTEDGLVSNTHSCMPFPVADTTEHNGFRLDVNGSGHIEWPKFTANKFQTTFLATMAFTTLSTCSQRSYEHRLSARYH